MTGSQESWDRLYATEGLLYGGAADISMMVPYLEPHHLVLDAGCGDGKTTQELLKHAQVVACDFSDLALRRARDERHSCIHAELVRCNLVSLPFESEKFEAAACVHSLSHMLARERHAAAKEIVRVVKPEGYVYFESFGRKDLRYRSGKEVEPATYERGTGIVTHYFEHIEIGNLFEGASVVRQSTVDRSVVYRREHRTRSLVQQLLKRS